MLMVDPGGQGELARVGAEGWLDGTAEVWLVVWLEPGLGGEPVGVAEGSMDGSPDGAVEGLSSADETSSVWHCAQ
jgi:hypothetical protein